MPADVPSSPELVVVGGGVSGCMAAVAATERGLSVVVVEKRAYLGREISAYNHTFVRCEADDDAFRRCPEPLQRLFRLHGDGEITAPEGLTRQLLMQIMDERGIPVLFEAEPVAVSHADKQANGLLLACPAGLAWLPAGAILDATENANLCRLLDGRPYIDKGATLVHAAFELGGPSDVESATRSQAEDALGLASGSVQFHPTLRKDAQVVEYAFRTDVSGELFQTRSRLESDARQTSTELASWFRENAPGFDKGALSHLGYECHVLQTKDAAPNAPTCCANITPILALPWGFSLDDVAESADAIRETVAAVTPRPVSAPNASGTLVGRGMAVPMATLSFEPYDDDALTIPLNMVLSTDALTPGAVFSCDVCVAGLGAGGGLAALAAAERGCRVTAIEVNRDLGGTHTTGRVVGYYAGYRGGANQAAVDEAGDMMPSAITGRGPGGLRHAEYLRRKANALGIQLLAGSRACGVRIEGGKVTQVLAANEDGLFAVEAKTTVDTTGDGDVAALAGASYQIGDDHDGMVQSYSMWGAEVYSTPSFLAQRYLTDPGLFHPDVYSERLRAISVAHRDNSYNHISPMLTPRESRRIEGEHALTMDDILTQKLFDDVVAVACTGADSHAYTSSHLAKLGGVASGKHLRVRIPYGCFIPKGIEGLLVAAKAISGERDATCFCRMNADIKNTGYAIGAAAAASAKANVGVREIDMPALQAELKEIGVLPEWAFAVDLDERLGTSVDDLKDGQFSAILGLLYCPSPSILSELEARYADVIVAEGDGVPPYASEKAMLCMALAWYGSALGGDCLAALMSRAVEEGRHKTLPHLNTFRTSLGGTKSPESDYAIISRLVVVAGQSGSDAVIPPLAAIVAGTPGLGDPLPLVMPYDRNRKDIVSEPFYRRLRNIAFAVERKADASLVPAMDTLLSRDGVTGYSVPMDSKDSPRYMRAHLEISLARAAARCGSRIGAGILVQCLADTHVFFRRHARRELALIAGGDKGSQAAWKQWLDTTPTWQAKPL